jgi:hypothetical protein
MAWGVNRRSVEADVQVTDLIRSRVTLCVEASDLGGVYVGVEGRSWVRMKTDENGRKWYYNIENRSGRFGIFLYFSN